MKPKAYIFDIDGTLAIRGDRGPFDWMKVGLDTENYDVTKVLDMIYSAGYDVIIVSGRDSVCKDLTKEWLYQHSIPWNHLYMRPEGDNRKDSIVKEEIYRNSIEPFYNVLGVFDDRNQVVEMWRSIGLTCFQVADGNF